ncbi:hypothetical protein BDW74DRAFT_100443 [Aspergillus multicolor]|uniref:uncharacterized protein n=1 Tax=Aspergillus multicolor TaxID=41759 RepID=UPI003CCD58D8
MSHRPVIRVSWPIGAQRSTYYLSLPYRYSILLQIASALLHWLVSQSLFFVRIVAYDTDGKPYTVEDAITCGYSPQAIIYAMILGSVLVGAAIVLGLRRFKSPMPLSGYCSAAISAACHPCVEGDHALKPVQWGEFITVASVVDSSPPPHEDEDEDADEQESAHALERERESPSGEADPLSCEEGDMTTMESSSNSVNENDQGSVSEMSNGDRPSDPLAGEGGDGDTPAYQNQNRSCSENAGVRYFHCSFTSAEVVAPNTSREYI